MKNSKIIITLLVACCCFLRYVSYGEDNKSTLGNIIILTKKNKDVLLNRPKSPSLQSITVAYDGEIVAISLFREEGICSCCITDVWTKTEHRFSFDSSDLDIELEIPEIKSFDIEIITEKGNTYTGSISIE